MRDLIVSWKVNIYKKKIVVNEIIKKWRMHVQNMNPELLYNYSWAPTLFAPGKADLTRACASWVCVWRCATITEKSAPFIMHKNKNLLAAHDMNVKINIGALTK